MNVISGKITSDGRLRFNCNHNKMFYGKVEILNKEGDFKAKIKPPFYFGNINKKVSEVHTDGKHTLECGCVVEYDKDKGGFIVTTKCNHDTSCDHDNCNHTITKTLDCGCVVTCNGGGELDVDNTNCILKKEISLECGCVVKFNEDKREFEVIIKCNHTTDCDHNNCIDKEYNTIIKFKISDGEPREPSESNNESTNDSPDLSKFNTIRPLGDNYYATTYDSVTEALKNNTNTNLNVISELYILDSANLASIDAYTFNRQNITDKNNVYHNIETLHLPESLEEIGDNAFNSIQDLTSLVIPDSVDTLGASVFNACGKLKHLSLSTKLTNIPNNCFSACGNLESLIIPNGVTYIGENAFSNCKSLSSLHLPETLTYIGTKAFFGCEKLKSLIIPSNIKTIGQESFRGCNELTQLIFSSVENENNEGVGESEGTDIINQENKDEEQTTINQLAFSGCGKLKKIILPKNFKTIAKETFSGCASLEELHLLNNDYYNNNLNPADAFAGANNLKKIVISNRMLFNPSACGFDNILQSINPQNNLIVQIDGLDIKNPLMVDGEKIDIEDIFNKDYIKNTSTLNGFKSSVLYTEFAGIFKNELNETIVKNMPYQEKDDYKCKFIDMNGVDIIDTFGGIDVTNYSQYKLVNSENVMVNKYVNIMDTVFDKVERIVLNDKDDTWGMLSSDGLKFTIKKDSNIPNIPNIPTELKYLQLSDKVDALEEKAFSGSNLREINISNVPTLPNNLCEGCALLTYFRYTPSKCNGVGINILKNCDNLETVIINDFYEFMRKEGTLYGCTNLKDIYINYQETGAGYAGWSINTYTKNENDEYIYDYSLPTSALSKEKKLNVHFMNLEFKTDGMYLNGILQNDDQMDQIIANITSNIKYQCFNHTFNTENGTTKLKINIYDNQRNNFMNLPIPEETQGN